MYFRAKRADYEKRRTLTKVKATKPGLIFEQIPSAYRYAKDTIEHEKARLIIKEPKVL